MSEDYKAPKSDQEDRAAIYAIGGGDGKTAVKAISKWCAEGKMLVEIATDHNITPQALRNFWMEKTTPEFRLETDKLQAEALYLKGMDIVETAGLNRNSTTQSRLRAKGRADVFFKMAERLDPQRWHPSAATRKAKLKQVEPEDAERQYGIDADYGDPDAAAHVEVLKGGVREEFRPKYDDVFQAEEMEPDRKKVRSPLKSVRINPFDTLDFSKLKRTNAPSSKTT